MIGADGVVCGYFWGSYEFGVRQGIGEEVKEITVVYTAPSSFLSLLLGAQFCIVAAECGRRVRDDVWRVGARRTQVRKNDDVMMTNMTYASGICCSAITLQRTLLLLQTGRQSLCL
jgi:hypothetical protein